MKKVIRTAMQTTRKYYIKFLWAIGIDEYITLKQWVISFILLTAFSFIFFYYIFFIY